MATKKEPASRAIPVNKALLTKVEREELLEQAKKSVLAEMEQDARDAYFKEALDKVRRQHVPAEKFVHLVIDIAPFLPHIMIDGVQYFHGYGYDVEQRQALVLLEQMQRSWQHQDEIDGRRKSDAYRRPQERKLGMSDAGTVTRGFATGAVIEAEI